jgi:hypothetical protein
MIEKKKTGNRMIENHFIERIDRMKELGLDTTEIRTMINKVIRFLMVNPHMENSAILVKELSERFYCKDGSKGEDLWIITRGGSLLTTMLRPRNRPKTINHFTNVDYVVIGS